MTKAEWKAKVYAILWRAFDEEVAKDGISGEELSQRTVEWEARLIGMGYGVETIANRGITVRRKR